MFKIARTVKQIFNVTRNVPKSLLSSINSGLKYCSQSKGYVEDANDEFTLLKVLPSQSSKASIQDKLKAFAPNSLNIAKAKPVQLLDSAEIRKLIYARFADEIGASKSTKEHLEACNTYDITKEFTMFKGQGYDFAATREILQNRNQDTNQKNLLERMKDLSISGYISNYAGEPSLRADIEKVIIQKELVINEFMQRFTDETEEHSTELLG